VAARRFFERAIGMTRVLPVQVVTYRLGITRAPTAPATLNQDPHPLA